MVLRISSRSEVAPFYVVEVLKAAEAREAEGADIVHLEVGQPSTPAPKLVLEAAHRLLDEDVLAYSDPRGIASLRRRIARHYDEWYGAAVDPSRIVVTIGASGACLLALVACFEQGDRIALPAPGYPAYRNMVLGLGLEPVDVLTGPETSFHPTPELLDEHLPIDGLVVASPNNPTGTMLDRDGLSAIVEWCREHGVRLVSDEIYHGITFGARAESVATMWADALVVNSFSKYFSMTGWRLGWLVVPDELRTPVELLSQSMIISPPTLAQLVAPVAFDCHDELEANVAGYAANRDILLAGLPTVGLDRLAPADGGFYIYAAVDHLSDDSQALCARWLDELGVAATPGIDFDPVRGPAHVRFSYAGSTAEMQAGIERLSGMSR